MEIKYTQEQIEKLLNIINTLPCFGTQNFTTASKLVEIYSILNKPLQDNQKKIKE